MLIACGPDKQQTAEIETLSKALTPTVTNFGSKQNYTVSCAPFGWLSEVAYNTGIDDVGDECGQIDETGLITFTAEFMALNPYFGEHGTSCLPISSGASSKDGTGLGWFFITRDGLGRGHNEHHDNDCDRWEYLPDMAKTYVGEKLAYMDKSMKILHQSDFSFGTNFGPNNLATVCTERPKKRFGPHKEHFARLGGKCGQINSDFEVVTPIELRFEDLHPLPHWAIPNYTRRAKIITRPGKAGEVEHILSTAFANLPDLMEYKINVNPNSSETLYVTERWVSKQAHTDSLSFERVQKAMTLGRPLIQSLELLQEHEYDPDNGIY